MSSGVIAEFLAKVGFAADEKSLDSALGKIRGFGLAVGAVAIAGAAAVLKIADRYDELGRASERLNTPIEEMQRLQYIAEQTGGSADAVTKSLEGIRAANPHIKDASAALEKAGQRMQGMSRAAREAYAARMGIDPSLIPMLTRDTSALSDEFSKMQALAGVNAKAAAEASRGLLSEIGKAKTLVVMLADSIGTALIGRLRGDVERLRRGVVENFGTIKRVLTDIIDVAMRMTGAVIAWIGRILTWGMRLVDWFNSLSDANQKVILAVAGLLAAWRLLNAGFLATPIGAIIAALFGLFAVIDDFQTWMEGGVSLINWGPWEADILAIIAALKPLMAILSEFSERALKAIMVQIGGIMKMLTGLGRLFKAIFQGDLRGALDAAKSLLANLFQTWHDTLAALIDLEPIKAKINQVIQSIQDLFAPLTAFVKLVFNVLSIQIGGFIKLLMGLGRLFKAIFQGDLRGVLDAAKSLLANLFQTWHDTLAAMIDLEPIKAKINDLIAFVSGIGTAIAATFRGAIETVHALIAAFITETQQLFSRLFDWDLFVVGATMAFDAIGAAISNFATLIGDTFSGIIGSIQSRFGDLIAWFGDKIKAVGDWVPDWMKGGLSMPDIAVPAINAATINQPALVPPAVANQNAKPSDTAVSLDQTTTIHVHSSSADPKVVANEVMSRQDDVNNRMVRNAKGAVR